MPKHTGLHTDLKIYWNEGLQVHEIAKAQLSLIALNSEGLLIQQRRANKRGDVGVLGLG